MKPILKPSAPKYNPNVDHCSCSPEGLQGCKYNKACYWHDMQYRDFVVNRKSRFVADLYLWRNIIIESWKVRKTSIIWSWIVGFIYFIGVRLFGKEYYQNS